MRVKPAAGHGITRCTACNKAVNLNACWEVIPSGEHLCCKCASDALNAAKEVRSK